MGLGQRGATARARLSSALALPGRGRRELGRWPLAVRCDARAGGLPPPPPPCPHKPVGLAWYSMLGSYRLLRQMAQVSVQMAQDHMATAFHFLISNRFLPLPALLLGPASSPPARCSSTCISSLSDIPPLHATQRAGTQPSPPGRRVQAAAAPKQVPHAPGARARSAGRSSGLRAWRLGQRPRCLAEAGRSTTAATLAVVASSSDPRQPGARSRLPRCEKPGSPAPGVPRLACPLLHLPQHSPVALLSSWRGRYRQIAQKSAPPAPAGQADRLKQWQHPGMRAAAARGSYQGRTCAAAAPFVLSCTPRPLRPPRNSGQHLARDRSSANRGK